MDAPCHSSPQQQKKLMTFGQLNTSAPGRRSGVTVWRQIADTLTTEIRNRIYADTGRLPGEVELSTRFGVNRRMHAQGCPVSLRTCWVAAS